VSSLSEWTDDPDVSVALKDALDDSDADVRAIAGMRSAPSVPRGNGPVPLIAVSALQQSNGVHEDTLVAAIVALTSPRRQHNLGAHRGRGGTATSLCQIRAAPLSPEWNPTDLYPCTDRPNAPTCSASTCR
jgi:hypothetical protein